MLENLYTFHDFYAVVGEIGIGIDCGGRIGRV
jgi:hypothetical protein